MSVPTTARTDPTVLTATALEFLAIHREAMAREKRTRLYVVRLAKHYGVTNREIADALGVTEAGVRMMLTRAGDPD